MSPQPLLIDQVDDFDSVQAENEELRRQLNQLQNRIGLEQDELITTLRKQNRQYRAKINHLQGLVAQIATTLRASFAACQDSMGDQTMASNNPEAVPIPVTPNRETMTRHLGQRLRQERARHKQCQDELSLCRAEQQYLEARLSEETAKVAKLTQELLTLRHLQSFVLLRQERPKGMGEGSTGTLQLGGVGEVISQSVGLQVISNWYEVPVHMLYKR
ncbi:hypothetical protein QQS21_002090 [Conoideocrella luteorostrata]|uniref:Uncharacterized protein n=1 Tax=Conoideocrella luteorostrata TaxID=1105319 RepID=A0AAJ0CY92_9HYPO|nr:hypothetical protein QQS21_002090 [Conoideocrella luteorostrata]